MKFDGNLVHSRIRLVLVTSINKFSCKYFSIKCSFVCCQKGKADVANNLYLIVQSTSSFHPLLISVENINLLPSSIYMHLKTNSIKYMQSLILWVCGSQHISVFSDIFQFLRFT